MIRDGGSYAATFLEASGKRHILFFQIKNTAEGGPLRPTQHLPPVLLDCDPAMRAEGYGVLMSPQIPVSWKDARKLLGEIASNKPREGDPQRSLFFEEWLQEMQDVANREGRLLLSSRKLAGGGHFIRLS